MYNQYLNFDVTLEQAQQQYQELLNVAEQHRLAQRALGHQPSALAHTLASLGELLVTTGEWLKTQGEITTNPQTITQ
jgi:hypothetical protein